MPILEVRRHTMRSKPGQHLSQDGVELANYVGKGTGPFDTVVSSEVPRAVETAIAMGFAIDYQIAELGVLPDNIYSAISWPNSMENISTLVDENEACRSFARKQANHWHAVLNHLSGNQTALIITHGGIIELGAVAFALGADYASWGGPIGYCEGFKFSHKEDEVICEVLRVPTQFQQIHN